MKTKHLVKRQHQYLLYLFLLLFLTNCSGLISLSEEKKATKKETNKTKQSPKVKNGLIASNYKSGELYSEVNYKKGKKDGLAKKYHKNGNLNSEITYKVGKKEGEAKLYYKSGHLKRITEYKNNKIDGKREQYFKNKTVSSSQTFKNGMPAADLKEYYTSGNKVKLPKIEYVVDDKTAMNGEYFVKFSFSEDRGKTEFYEGELVEGKFLDEDQLVKLGKDGNSGIVYRVIAPGTFLMQKLNIIGVMKTKKGNYLIRELNYNIAIQG